MKEPVIRQEIKRVFPISEKSKIVLLIMIVLISEVLSAQDYHHSDNLQAGIGVPFNLEKRIDHFLQDSMQLNNRLNISYHGNYELEFADKWRVGCMLVLSNFNYKNDQLDVGISQYCGYLTVGYNWRFSEEWSLENVLVIGATQLRQSMYEKSSEKDLWDSYTSGNQNMYYNGSQTDFSIGHAVTVHYAFGKRWGLFFHFLYSFNRNAKLQLNKMPVFRPITTPSFGLTYRINRNIGL